MPKSKAILIDLTKCIGCLSCEGACKELHGFPSEPEPKLSPTAFTIVEQHGDRFVRRMCMNCEDPACASAWGDSVFPAPIFPRRSLSFGKG
jgi:formate dehydrogenase iron-sulfur subunit